MASRQENKHHLLDLCGRTVALEIRRHPRARHLTLRIADNGTGAIVTMPRRATIAEALAMAHEKAGWILEGLDAHPGRVAFVDGAEVPYLDEPHRVRHAPGKLGVRREDGELRIAGGAAHLSRRLKDWLKAEARALMCELAHEKAISIGHKPGRITLRDTRSRWGSCAAGGNLNFSWRLIMAPRFVLEYVVAHEVAHLAHPNHSKAFWREVGGLSDQVDTAETWLDRHGRGLHRYG